jgi:hypothetical protein
MVQSDERRGFNLHIDYNWEESLPNLNPLKAEIAVGWSLRILAEALVAGAVEWGPSGEWIWHIDDRDRQALGANLLSALYWIGDLHRRPDPDFERLRKALEKNVRDRLHSLGAEERPARRKEEADRLEKALFDIARRKLSGEMRPQDSLERPILSVLLKLVQSEGGNGTARSGPR